MAYNCQNSEYKIDKNQDLNRYNNRPFFANLNINFKFFMNRGFPRLELCVKTHKKSMGIRCFCGKTTKKYIFAF